MNMLPTVPTEINYSRWVIPLFRYFDLICILAF
jgi:hypothetical protein